MPTWLIVVLTLVGVLGFVTLIFQLPRQNRFIDTAGGSDPAKLVAWLDRGVDPNQPGWMGLTALGCAVMKRRTENVRILLERGANPNAPAGAASYLCEAVECKDHEILTMLLDAGAEPDQVGRVLNVPLHGAILSGNREAVQILLNAGANADHVDLAGNPLLASALLECEKKADSDPQIGILRDLLAAGANPNRRTRSDAPLIALALNSPVALRVLIDHGVMTDVEWNGLELGAIIESLTEDASRSDSD